MVLVLLSDTDIFICTKLNGFKHYNSTLIIQLNINHLVKESEIVFSIVND